MKQTLLTEIKPFPGTCFKCGSTRNVIKHHISYNPEIIVDCCRSCHQRIHKRIRKDGLCPISIKETHRLSAKSSGKDLKSFLFNETVAPYIRLREEIKYNTRHGTITISSWFSPNHNKKIYYLGE